MRRNILKDESVTLPKRQRRLAIPSRTDIAKLLDTANTLRENQPLHAHVIQRAVVNLGLFAGLRPGETFGLQWENVDEAHGVLRIQHSQSKFDGLKNPKTDAGVRTVPLTDSAREALQAVARFRACQIMAKCKTFTGKTRTAELLRVRTCWRNPNDIPADLLMQVKTGYVLMAYTGNPLSTQSLFETWATLMRDAGLLDPETGLCKFTPHALRHAAASLMIASGMPPLNLKQVMGHSSVTTTYDIYGHLFPEDNRTRMVLDDISRGFNATTEQQTPVTN